MTGRGWTMSRRCSRDESPTVIQRLNGQLMMANWRWNLAVVATHYVRTSSAVRRRLTRTFLPLVNRHTSRLYAEAKSNRAPAASAKSVFGFFFLLVQPVVSHSEKYKRFKAAWSLVNHRVAELPTAMVRPSHRCTAVYRLLYLAHTHTVLRSCTVWVTLTVPQPRLGSILLLIYVCRPTTRYYGTVPRCHYRCSIKE